MVREHREAFGRYRTNRYSERIKADFDAMYGWPGARAAGRSVTAGEQPGDPASKQVQRSVVAHPCGAGRLVPREPA
jgi:hypothetical protein